MDMALLGHRSMLPQENFVIYTLGGLLLVASETSFKTMNKALNI